ncbi:MAG: 3-dehydroquinate synthase [Ignavibacteria bacterium]|nr:3-dehydroquinate synthase [Ignavibacteria bacterium]
MKRLKIETLYKTSQILIDENIVKAEIKKLKDKYSINNVFIVIDKNVKLLYPDVVNFLNKEFLKVTKHIVNASEKNKSLKSIEQILTKLSKENYGRDSWLISIGGGITGDIAGFAASIYKRGIKLVQIPTTLLAVVDSSVGGKTGINFNNKKNIVGTFFQPDYVLIDTKFLKTLPEREIICGIGEVIKYGYLYDLTLFKYISNNLNNLLKLDSKSIEMIIHTSLKIKAAIVAQDETEEGIRKILNLGHTFAHAFESSLNFRIKHGEAVIAGIRCSLFLSFIKGLIDEVELNHLLSLSLSIPLKAAKLKTDKSSAYRAMLSDKKNRNGQIKFVLVKGVGEIVIDVEATKDEVYDSLKLFQATLI